MRRMGLSLRWAKLWQPEFTTFRTPRKDKDWFVGEKVRVVFQPRSKNRQPLFLAEIVAKEPKTFDKITSAEAIADGFSGIITMWAFLENSHPRFKASTPLNKLTLKRQEFHDDR